MLTVEETRALGNTSPEFAPMLETGNPLLRGWTHETDILAIRDMMETMRRHQAKPDPATLAHTEQDIEIPLRDGLKTAARVYKPRQVPPDGCPGMVVFHGGGYMVGDLETEARLCALFTKLGGIAVNVNYRHAPEHPFPAAVEDALDATSWTAQNAESLGINAKKGLLVGGESSGADLSLVVAHLCRDSNMSPPLTGVYASIPSGASEETVPEKYKDWFFSFEQNSDAPLLTTESVDFIRRMYKADLTSPLALPIAFEHAGLPKTYIQACGLDPVRDCAIVMEQVLRDAGVQTRMDIYPGLPHAFWAFFPQLSSAKKHSQDAETALEWLLGR